MATALDLEMGPVVTELLAEYGGTVVFRDLLGVVRTNGINASFSSTAISIAAADDSINWSAPNDFTAQGIAADSWIHLDGAQLKIANRGWAKVTSVTATKVVLDKELETQAAGFLIGVTRSQDHEGKGYVSEWQQKDWNGSTILPTDGMVITDLQLLPADFEDRPTDFIFFDGPDPASAKQYEIPTVKAIRTGELAPLGMVGIRK